MRGRKIAVLILNEVQMLNQEIAPARPIGQECTHFNQRLRVDLTALWRAGRATPATSPVLGGQLLRDAHFSPPNYRKTH